MDLVTGGTGIVGVHVLRELLHRGRLVRALARAGSDTSIVGRVFAHYGDEALLDRIHWVEGDLLDVLSLEEAMDGVERVFHAAAEVSFNPGDTRKLDRVNRKGTANVVNAALRTHVKLLVHVSSTAAIGEVLSGRPATEDDAFDPGGSHSPYADSKWAAELEVERGRAEGLEAVIANPCIVLGPGRGGRSSMGLVDRLARGSRYYPPGSNAVVDARDVAHALVELADKRAITGRYLLIGENLSYRELFGKLATSFGHPAPGFALRPWMLRAAASASTLLGPFLGGRSLVTRHTVRSSLARRSWSAGRVKAELGMRFRSAGEAVANVAAFRGRPGG